MSASAAPIGSYKGDSFGKRLARAYLWLRILHNTAALPGRFAYLASREGGDAAVLTALGVPPERQLAIDRDAAALRAFAHRFPKVPTACGDAAAVLDAQRDAFAAVFLDFCSPAGPAIVDPIVAAVRRVASGGAVAFAVMRGREMAQRATIREVAERHQRARAAWDQRLGLQPDTLERTALPRGIRRALDDLSRRLSDGRGAFVQEAVQARVAAERRGLLLDACLVYQSRTRESPGVPMLVDLWTVDAYAPSLDRARFDALRAHARWRRRMQRAQEILGALHAGLSLAQPAEATAMLRPTLDKLRRRTQVLADFSAATPVHLVELAAELPPECAAQALNASPSVLAGWRAHVARGTYKPSLVLAF